MKFPVIACLLLVSSFANCQTWDNYLSVVSSGQTEHTAMNVHCEWSTHIMNQASVLQDYTEDLIAQLGVDEYVYLDINYDYSDAIIDIETDRIGFIKLNQITSYNEDLKHDGIDDELDESTVLYLRISAENLDVTQVLATIEYALTHKTELSEHQTVTYNYSRSNVFTGVETDVQYLVVDEVYQVLLLHTPITERTLSISAKPKKVSLNLGSPPPGNIALKGYFFNNKTFIYKMNEGDSTLVNEYSSIYEIHSSPNGRVAIFKNRNTVDVYDDDGSVYTYTLPRLSADNYRRFFVLDNAKGNVEISYFPVRDCSPIDSFSKDNLVVVEYSNTDQSFRLKQDWKDCE